MDFKYKLVFTLIYWSILFAGVGIYLVVFMRNMGTDKHFLA